MDDPLGVRVRRRFADVLEDLQPAGQLVSGIGACRQQLGQAPSLNQVHREIRAVAQPAHFMDGDDAWVLQPRADEGLAREPLDRLAPGLQVFRQDFDRQFPVQTQVPSTEDYAHAARADSFPQSIARVVRQGPGGLPRTHSGPGRIHLGDLRQGRQDCVLVIGRPSQVIRRLDRLARCQS